MKRSLNVFLKLAAGAILIAIVYFGWTLLYQGDDSIRLLEPSKPYTSIKEILQTDELRGKVVYADMWGTTCGPCLEEFKNHTKPLKKQYQNNKSVAFLYVCLDKHPGAEYRWKKRIKDFDIKGYHVLLNEEQFVKFYGEIANTSGSEQYAIPRYFIVSQRGDFVSRDAKRPSDYKTLYAQIDSTIALL